MPKRLDAKERTRRDIKHWLGEHGFPKFVVNITGAFAKEEIFEMVFAAAKEGIENRWEKMEQHGENAHENLLS